MNARTAMMPRMLRPLRRGSGLAVLLCLAAASRAAAQDETHYARAVAYVADSAIHRLDFFPTRAQLHVQMLFLAPHDSLAGLFTEIARRSANAASAMDETSFAFERTPVPDDLHALHGALLSSLRSARSALDRLASASAACASTPSSVSRCQAPFTAASAAVGQAYARYLDVRARIAEQVADTKTLLPAFAVSRR